MKVKSILFIFLQKYTMTRDIIQYKKYFIKNKYGVTKAVHVVGKSVRCVDLYLIHYEGTANKYNEFVFSRFLYETEAEADAAEMAPWEQRVRKYI